MTKRRDKKPTWRSGADYRIVCDCQQHRAARGVSRAVRAFGERVASMRRHGLTLLVGVPLALGVLEPPGEARNAAAPDAAARKAIEATVSGETFPVFTTPLVREQFLNPPAQPQRFSIEVAKEEFFRTQIPYGAIIYREAKRNGLPPELVAAVVHTESDFRPRLVSHKNAHGLMQLIPSTAKLMGARNVFDPEENVAAGTRYLRYLMNRFGDQTIALAAYNAGEGNVERFGGIPPFPETRNYVKRVDRRMARYRDRVESTYQASVRMRQPLQAH
jgi:soluble lytic murein transglycosylase-like protein